VIDRLDRPVDQPAVQCLSIVTVDMLPAARVMAASVRAQHPEWALELVIVGSPDVAIRARQGQADGVRVTSVPEALEVSLEDVLARHGDAEELRTLLIAALLDRRIREVSGLLVHLPATAWALGSLDGLTSPLEEHEIVLAPRVASDPPSDGVEPTPETLRRVGRISPDLIAVRASANAETFLAWWLTNCERMYGDLGGRRLGLRGEHHRWLWRSLELALTRPGVATIRDPGLGASAWNLHEHALSANEGGLQLDGGTPVRLLDLAGFQPEMPWRLHPLLARTRVRRGSPLSDRLEEYATLLRSAGRPECSTRAAIGHTMPNGLRFDESLHRLSLTAAALGVEHDPLTLSGADALKRWLRSPAPRGGEEGVSRYLYHRVLSERLDVVKTFPSLEGEDARGLLAWADVSGRAELELAEPLMGTPDPAADTTSTPAEDASAAAAAAITAAQITAGSPPPAVRVSGYMGHVLGLGAAARGYASALQASGVTLSTMSVSLDELQRPLTHESSYGRYLHEDLAGDGCHGAELICVNPDELPHYVTMLGREFFRGRRIGVWGWETTSIPARWAPAFEFIDEIWVYSRFVAESFATATEKPVVALPPPVSPPVMELAPSRLGVPDGFLFLFVFDYSSTIQRKNPVGLIRAFQRAFAEGEGPQLLIKTINGPRHPLAEDEVLWATDGRRDIHVIDRSLSGTERDALMLGCDCYVSLHRSEGFGLTMAEAMAVGKPVIATGYSGNVDFMNVRNSYLVDYEVIRVGPDVQIYPADGEWAEPSIEHAAALMREVYEGRAQAAERGDRARHDIARVLSPEATGAAMRARLEDSLG
jgi:glycosyltransferase involved in cell wall biosynthesis